nr:PREDICTED: wiskott-Aldrich syndrome protein homolog 1-like [Rhinolophus sinicus]
MSGPLRNPSSLVISGPPQALGMGNKRGPHGGRSGAAGLDPLQVRHSPRLGRLPYPRGIPKGTFLQVEPPPPTNLAPSAWRVGEGTADGLSLTMKSGSRTKAHAPDARPPRRHSRGPPPYPPLLPLRTPAQRPPPLPSPGRVPTHPQCWGCSPPQSPARVRGRRARDPPRVRTSPAAEASPARIPQRRARAAAGSGRGPLPLKGPGSLSYPCPPLDVTAEWLGGVGPGVTADGSRTPARLTPSFFPASANLPPAVPSSATPPNRGMDLQVLLSAEPPTPTPVPVSGLPPSGWAAALFPTESCLSILTSSGAAGVGAVGKARRLSPSLDPDLVSLSALLMGGWGFFHKLMGSQRQRPGQGSAGGLRSGGGLLCCSHCPSSTGQAQHPPAAYTCHTKGVGPVTSCQVYHRLTEWGW